MSENGEREKYFNFEALAINRALIITPRGASCSSHPIIAALAGKSARSFGLIFVFFSRIVPLLPVLSLALILFAAALSFNCLIAECGILNFVILFDCCGVWV